MSLVLYNRALVYGVYIEMSCKTTKPTNWHVLPEKTQPGHLPSQVRDFAVDFRVAKVKLPSCQRQRI